MWDAKLEVSSLICQKHLIRCGMMLYLQTNSKWNMGKFNKPFEGILTESKQRVVLNRQVSTWKKYQCWSTSRLRPWSFVVFYFY